MVIIIIYLFYFFFNSYCTSVFILCKLDLRIKVCHNCLFWLVREAIHKKSARVLLILKASLVQIASKARRPILRSSATHLPSLTLDTLLQGTNRWAKNPCFYRKDFVSHAVVI